MNLTLRFKKKLADRFVEHVLDEEQYSIPELEELVNNAIYHKSSLTLAAEQKNTSQRLIKFDPHDVDNVSVLLEHDA